VNPIFSQIDVYFSLANGPSDSKKESSYFLPS